MPDDDTKQQIPAQSIGGTFTLTYGSQVSEPLSYDTSREVADHVVSELFSADRVLRALIRTRAIRHN